eukprot:CAMPEP_0168522118 /NCGR_PEP_ID=MMETSP0405-20121227/9110_1 /TAXON_ID=498012 /ORGANISM="Trichosphaerium sp, Strain Am-I-7 wt" /LENGTH=187 /DNA_ID=CAMNT_0008543565 /DNA_START=440 /DNA_END=1000 /DNA_ORIENTATION=+
MKKKIKSIRSGEHKSKPDNESKTTGILQKMKWYYGVINFKYDVIFCTHADFYGTSYGDGGWGCGYRNLQMLSSCLIKQSEFKSKIFGGCKFVPSILSLQEYLEAAWKSGIDREGAKLMNNKVSDTKKLIGTSEVGSILEYFGIKYEIRDFITIRGKVFEYEDENGVKQRVSQTKTNHAGHQIVQFIW